MLHIGYNEILESGVSNLTTHVHFKQPDIEASIKRHSSHLPAVFCFHDDVAMRVFSESHI